MALLDLVGPLLGFWDLRGRDRLIYLLLIILMPQLSSKELKVAFMPLLFPHLILATTL